MEKSTLPLKIDTTPPEGFSPQIKVAACYIEIDGKILLLQRAKDKSEPGKWGVPAGKLEADETALQAAQRELWEETGILLKSVDHFQHFKTLYIHKPECNYIYFMFKVSFTKMPPIFLSKEHEGYQWIARAQIEMLPLMDGARESLQYYQDISKQ